MKPSSKHVKKYFLQIFNASFRKDIVLDKLKSAVILLIHKGETKMLCSNDRPISILHIFRKVIAKLMYIRLIPFLDGYDICINVNNCFQRDKSTDLAILDSHTYLTNAVENRKKSCSTFLDFTKAIDTVNHDILLKKLASYGIRGFPLNWFKSYLSGRYQLVRINNFNSGNKAIVCGVPQGSILGFLLFVTYINGIYK